MAVATVALGELGVWTVARFVPLTSAPLVAAVIPLAAFVGWLAAGIRARPRLGEAALALDVEAQLGDRVSSALELAAEYPASAGPETGLSEGATANQSEADTAIEVDRFVASVTMPWRRSGRRRPGCSRHGSRANPPWPP
jgi:hypothetical protein